VVAILGLQVTEKERLEKCMTKDVVLFTAGYISVFYIILYFILKIPHFTDDSKWKIKFPRFLGRVIMLAFFGYVYFAHVFAFSYIAVAVFRTKGVILSFVDLVKDNEDISFEIIIIICVVKSFIFMVFAEVVKYYRKKHVVRI